MPSKALLAGDDVPAMRQVGIVDGHGGVAAHTGDGCLAEAGHVLGEHWACQANMMAGDTVPAAMSAAFAAAGGDLADRLMAALEAAESAGGDVRGRQSAALLVVPATGERGAPASICASRTTTIRSASCADCWRCSARTPSPARVTS